MTDGDTTPADGDAPADGNDPAPVTPDPTPAAPDVDLQSQMEAMELRHAKELGVRNAEGQKYRQTINDLKSGDGDAPKSKAKKKDGGEAFQQLAIRTEFMAELRDQGVAKETAEVLALDSIDLSGVEVEGNRILGMADAVTSYLKERPALVQRPNKPSPGTVNGSPGGTNTEPADLTSMSKDQLKALPSDQFFALAAQLGTVKLQIGDEDPHEVNISPEPNEAFGRVHGVTGDVIRKMSGGGSK